MGSSHGGADMSNPRSAPVFAGVGHRHSQTRSNALVTRGFVRSQVAQSLTKKTRRPQPPTVSRDGEGASRLPNAANAASTVSEATGASAASDGGLDSEVQHHDPLVFSAVSQRVPTEVFHNRVSSTIPVQVPVAIRVPVQVTIPSGFVDAIASSVGGHCY